MRAAVAAGGLLLLVAACSGHSSGTPGPATSASVPPPSSSPGGPGFPDWPSYHGDPARTGFSTTMPAVHGTPSVLTTLRLDAAVYASPIVVRGMVIVATENDSVYAFDAAGHQLWQRSLGTPAHRSQLPCGNIDPSGITGTPVYDAATATVYLVAEHGGPVRHELVAIDPQHGSVRLRTSIDLPGVAPNAMQQRGALTISGGRVWVPFGGRAGDCGDYKGRVVGVPLVGQGAPIAYTVPTEREAGIWAPPGPTLDADGHLYVAVGNGASGVGDRYDHSDSVLELNAQGELLSSFSPTNWPTDNDADLDLGSQGPALVGPWVFIAGKSGIAYVLRQGSLGGIGGEVSSDRLCRSFGGTAVANGVVYVPCTDGLRAVRIDSAGRLRVLWHANESITGSPVVGGGRVWALDPQAGVLHALDPASGRSTAQVTVGRANRFATPAIAGSELLVPTLTGLSVVRTS